jgi:hypothetical protein
MDSTLSRFAEYHTQTPQEKIYLRTDKEQYTWQETIWFSVYLTDAVTHQPGYLSNLVYVDLIDPDDSVISTLNIKVEGGLGHGDFFIADSLGEGIYRLRAYTNYMLNFDRSLLFTKPVKILDFSSRTAIKPEEPEFPEIDIHFFPEGGNLLANELNYVAFKVENATGKGVDVRGRIVDENGSEVQMFETEVFGMGKFQLQPESGKRYFATFDYKGVPFSKALPIVNSNGYLFNVRSTSEKIYLTVKGSEDVSMTDAFILGHIRGAAFLMLKGVEGQPFIYKALESRQLPSGILHFTLFDPEGNPRCERLVYNENTFDLPSVIVQEEDYVFDRRSEAKLPLEWGDALQDTRGSISVSVLPETLYGANSISIRNYLTLASDLKGQIEHPEYYDMKENPKRLSQIDLLMMTHGWRRFDWDNVLTRKLPPVNFYPEQGFSIEGQIVKYLNREKGVLGNVKLTFLENIAFAQEANSEEDGTFWFDGIQVEDTVTAIIRTQRLKEKGAELSTAKGGTFIRLKEQEKPEVIFNYPDPEPIDQSLMSFVDQSLKIQNIEAEFGGDVMVLDEIQVKAQKDIREEPFYRESILYSEPDDRLVLDSLVAVTTFPNLFELMKGKFPGVRIEGLFPDYTAIIRGFSSINQSNEALFLVDGIPTDPSLVAQIPPDQVEFIDILRGPKAGLYSAQGNGVIAIYKRRGPRALEALPDPVNLISFTMNGYYPAREFYVPNYDKMTDEEKMKPDFRTTLYWNPNIVVKKGKAEIEFFTSDDRGRFNVFIEGITVDGKVLQDVIQMEVR